MSKKILSCILCAALTASSLTVLAADVENGQPDVYVNDSKIVFSDQAAQIVNDRTLVPARGVFEAMGNRVEWNDETRTVKVTSSTGVTVATIVIDSAEMTVRTYKSLLVAEDVTVELDVPAQIMNDRTMIPLRAVSEAFNCEVEWDEENYCVNITTGEPARLEGAIIPTPTPDEEKVTMSLSTDVTEVSEGDEFTVYVDVDNFVENSYLSGITATFAFDKTKLEYISGTLLDNNDTPYDATIVAENKDYGTGAKVMFTTITDTNAKNSNGKILAITFKALSDDIGNIAFVDEYVPGYGYGTCLMFNIDKSDKIYDGQNIIVDTTPLTIGE